MKPETRERLDAINRVFYDEQAAAFEATRDHPWPGWGRVVSALPPLPRQPPGGRVLDVACGNGRFGAFLAGAAPWPFRYVGLDASARLLDAARASLAPLASQGREATFEVADVVGQPPSRWLAEHEPFDWIVLFGLLHHVPGANTRRALLEGLVTNLRPGGGLALSVWRFGDFDRFRRRIVPWDSVAGIDSSELEPGDHLLRWGESHVRYCHALGEDELATHLSGLAPLAGVVDRFDADGREGNLNRYILLQRRDDT